MFAIESKEDNAGHLKSPNITLVMPVKIVPSVPSFESTELLNHRHRQISLNPEPNLFR